MTEKHYSPWVRAMQEQLEADVRRAWETKPLAACDNMLSENGGDECKSTGTPTTLT
jgi:hypothetical protein